jgi:hypothetical protein
MEPEAPKSHQKPVFILWVMVTGPISANRHLAARLSNDTPKNVVFFDTHVSRQHIEIKR